MKRVLYSRSLKHYFNAALLFFCCFVFFNIPLIAQPNVCDHSEIGITPAIGDNCFSFDFRLAPLDHGNNPPANIQVDQLKVIGDLVGEGYIEGFELLGPFASGGIYDGMLACSVIGNDKKSFICLAQCNSSITPPNYILEYGVQFVAVKVVTAPSVGNNINEVYLTNVVTETFKFVGCNPINECEWDQLLGDDPFAIPQTPSCNNLSLEIIGLPLNGTQEDRVEVPLTLRLKNNGIRDININEIDFGITITDEFGNMPDVTSNLTLNIPQNVDPFEESHTGDNHYYHFGELASGNIIPAGTEVEVLAFTILPPDGLDNLEGLSNISIGFFRLDYEVVDGMGQTLSEECCAVSADPGFVHYIGDQPCDYNEFPKYVNFVARPAFGSNPGCEVRFELVAGVYDPANNNDDSEVDIEELVLELETTTSGNLMHAQIIPDNFLQGGNSGFEVCSTVDCPTTVGGDCFGCGGNTISFSYSSSNNNGTPLHLTWGDKFTVILDGLNGCLDGVEFKVASIKMKDKSNVVQTCIPDVTVDLNLPMCSACNFCNSTTIELAGYQVHDLHPPGPALGSCQNGFSVYLNSPSGGITYQQIKAELILQNTGNVLVSANANAGLCNGNSCVSISGNTITFDKTFPIPITPAGQNLRLMDILVTGNGCISDAMFTAGTEVVIQTSMGLKTCNPAEVSPNDPVVGGTMCTTCTQGQFSVGGAIADEDGDDVDIPLGADSGIDIRATTLCYEVVATDGAASPTDCDGNYTSLLQCSGEEESITITPQKDINPLNGVTTYDLVLITKHILGTDLLDSPYQMIAADANKSNTVTTFDMVEIRKLILYINTEFPNNTSWRFVDKDYTFPNPSDPWQEAFPEIITINDPFSSGQNGAANNDFVAIKIGDVNRNANCNKFQDDMIDDRQEAVTMKAFAPTRVEADGAFILELTVVSKEPLSAWQMGLHFDPEYLELEGVDEADMEGVDIRNFGLTEKENGKVRALWYSPTAETLDFDGTFRFAKLRFRALKTIGNLEDHVHIDQEVLQTVAYSENGAPYNMQLSFGNQSAKPTEGGLQPIKVYPPKNPFANQLTIAVELPADMTISVKVVDLSGHQVAAWVGDAEKGRKEVVFKEAGKWQSGLYTWIVTTGVGTTTGQVVKQ